ncbi:MAG: hypothetical protein GXO94_04520 [Nitrospirae bacterium]|nr:hypothetical protein [Nitrospirota bacterium]
MKRLAVVLSVSLFFALLMTGSCASVPVVPNETVVEGRVSEYAIVSSRLVGIEPEQVLYRITIQVESSSAAGRGPDFLRDRVGEDVPFYTKKILSPRLFGRKVRVRVEFRGDEKGGLFWVRDVELR